MDTLGTWTTTPYKSIVFWAMAQTWASQMIFTTEPLLGAFNANESSSDEEEEDSTQDQVPPIVTPVASPGNAEAGLQEDFRPEDDQAENAEDEEAVEEVEDAAEVY